MSFITTNPNPYIVNVPELQSVITSATGISSSNDSAAYTQYIDTATNSATFNGIGSFNSGNVAFTSDVYLSDAGLYVAANGTEVARLNSNGLGIFTQTPAAALHVNGTAIFSDVRIQSDSGSVDFYNAAGVQKAGLDFTESGQKITLVNTSGDVAIDAIGGGVTIATDTDLVLDGPNILAVVAGAASGNYLRIKVNGAYYKLALLAD
jgi:hypothetical protein